MMKFNLPIALLIIAITLCTSCSRDYDIEYEITLSRLADEFRNNRPRAENKYRNKFVLMTDTKIDRIINDRELLLHSNSEKTWSSVLSARLEGNQIDSVLDMNRGDIIDIGCYVTGVDTYGSETIEIYGKQCRVVTDEKYKKQEQPQ